MLSVSLRPMAQPVLAPLDFGGIFDQAFKLYTGRWRTLLTISAVVMIPLGIVSLLITVAVFPDLDVALSDPDLVTASPQEVFDLLGRILLPTLLVGVINVVGLWLIQGSCTHAVAEVYNGREPDWRRSLAAGFRRLPSYLATMILMGLGIIGGFFLCFVGSVWFGIMWAVAIPALIAEDLGPWGALKRSWSLIQGSFWRTLGLTIVSGLIVGVVGIALASPTQFVVFSGGSLTASQATSQVANTLAYTLTLPFQALVAVVIYFDQRVRKEAFDLQTLSDGLRGPDVDRAFQPPSFPDSDAPSTDLSPPPPPPPSDRDDPGGDPFQ